MCCQKEERGSSAVVSSDSGFTSGLLDLVILDVRISSRPT